jgi:hypothetical protein
MASSPGCWAAYGEVLAREYSDPAYWSVHRVTVDCYAVQHPGTPSPQSINSVGLHLIRLCATLERELPPDAAPNLLQRLANERRPLRWLEPPASLGPVTVADVHEAASAEEHRDRVMEWAAALWNAWSDHHAQIRAWLDDASARLDDASMNPALDHSGGDEADA